MYMNVDVQIFEELMSNVNTRIKRLRDSKDSLAHTVQKAGQDFSGPLYEMIRREVNTACSRIDASVENLERMNAYFQELEHAVNDYLNCCYEE